MKTSIIQLASTGQNLPGLVRDISYPEGGSARLRSAEAKHFWFAQRRQTVFKILRAFLPRQTVLPIGVDVGCGTGYNAAWFTEHGLPTVGIDAHEGFGELKAQRRARGFIQGDIFSVDPKPEFDFAVLLDVIEHADDDLAFVNQTTKMLKPGGILLFTVPAFQSLWTKVDEAAGHKRRYTKGDTKKFESDQLRLKYQTYFFATTLPLYFLQRWSVGKKEDVHKHELEIHPLANLLLNKVVALESFFLPHISLPIGSSLLAVYQKSLDEI